jgi:hypothetical protein
MEEDHGGRVRPLNTARRVTSAILGGFLGHFKPKRDDGLTADIDAHLLELPNARSLVSAPPTLPPALHSAVRECAAQEGGQRTTAPLARLR